MKGLILAAGMGSRLMPLTADRPKPFVQAGSMSLFERLVRQCVAVGVEEVVVVTGYRHDYVAQWLEAHSFARPIRTVFNAEYDTLNNAHSVWVAKDALAGSAFIKFDGDLVMDTDILRRLVASPHRTVAVVDRDERVDEEAMKVQLDDDGHVLAFGKWLALEESHGESIGVEKIGAEDSALFFDAIHRVVHEGGRSDAYYEDVYHEILSDDWRMESLATGGARWSEVDTPADLDRVRSWVDDVEHEAAECPS